MIETQINDYGKDKLKNLAKYTKRNYYPIIHEWVDRHTIEPQRKFILYYAIPDDRGNVFVIPGKWCEGMRMIEDDFAMALDLNELALEQLNKAGTFSGSVLYPIIKVWEDINPKGDENKKKFDVFYAILDEEKHIFIVQSTWGKLMLLDKDNNPAYT